MTDNEIIEAVNYCANVKCYEDCKKCPIKNTCDTHAERLVIVVADLINRQKAEIDFLKTELSNCEFLKKEYELDKKNQQAEIERLKEFEYMYNELCK